MSKYLIYIVSIIYILVILIFKLYESYSEISFLEDKSVEVFGNIDSEAKVGAYNSRYVLDIEYVISEGDRYYVDEKLIFSTFKYAEYEIGDEVVVSGKLERPENFLNDNGIEFDYVNFLAKDSIYFLIQYSRVELINENVNITNTLIKFKRNFLYRISRILPAPHAELMGGLLLGVKQSLGKELENDFRRVGLIHVVVLSGFNITIIIVAVFKLLGFLPKILKYILGILFILSFAVMVGLGATVVRATIMSLIAIFGTFVNREYDVNRSLWLAGLIMLIHNPAILLHDPSFQLSFVASLGLINISPRMSELLSFIPSKFEMREIVSATTSTQIAVLPLILNMTGDLSIVALPVNLIVLPLISFTMLLGVILGILTYLNMKIALVFGLLAYLLLAFQLYIVEIFSSLPFAIVVIKYSNIYFTLLFYTFIIPFFCFSPVQIREVILNILSFARRLIVSHK